MRTQPGDLDVAGTVPGEHGSHGGETPQRRAHPATAQSRRDKRTDRGRTVSGRPRPAPHGCGNASGPRICWCGWRGKPPASIPGRALGAAEHKRVPVQPLIGNATGAEARGAAQPGGHSHARPDPEHKAQELRWMESP
ncbi:MAG: hypothetical protein KatS3mg027_0023 [Bacteroidia bacterium]|nr:MAG: hypothetical protein KatS3mg027_0023 [Bacteroidia bacterium]